MQTYTPQQGLTPQGQQQSSMTNTLGAITNKPPQQQITAGDVAKAQLAPIQYQQQIPAKLQQAQQQLTQQSGIPQLQQSSATLGQLFPMWLADQNLSQKYANQSLSSATSPVYNANLQPSTMSQQVLGANTQTSPNPYLASPTDIVNALTQKGSGFSAPGIITGEMNQVPQTAGNIMNILQNAIGSEQGLVGQKLGDISQNYQAALGGLQGIGNLVSNLYGNQVNIPGSPQNTGAIEDQILTTLGVNATPQDVWNYINTHDASLRAQGVDVNSLWQWQKNLAAKSGQNTTVGVGKVKGISTGKVPKQTASTGNWTMPDGTVLKQPFNIFGISPLGGQVVNVPEIYTSLRAHGYSDSQITEYLTTKGYTVQ